MGTDLPEAVVDEALRLTRLARDAAGEERAVYRRRRADLLAEHDYVARVRESGERRRAPGATDPSGPAGGTSAGGTSGGGTSGGGTSGGGTSGGGTPGDKDAAVLVVHPSGWVEDGTVRFERIEDLSRAIERPLDGSSGEDWATVEVHNREIAARVRRNHGAVHGATAHAFADFLGNHYVRRGENATRAHVEEFLDEYFPRNAWPSNDQESLVLESLALFFETAGDTNPPVPDVRVENSNASRDER